MNSLQIYHNERFGQVRGYLDEDGNPWFVAADVCAALELNDPHSSLALLDDDEKGLHSMETLGGAQEMLIISEPGLYSLMLRSRKPEAKAFKRWVTHEVIPSIRQTGRYINGQTDECVDILIYIATLRQMARKKIYPDRMRVEFLAKAASLLSGCPADRFMPPEWAFQQQRPAQG